VECLGARDPARPGAAVGSIGFALLPGDGERAAVGLGAHAEVESLGKDEGVAVDFAALGEENGFVVVEVVVPAEGVVQFVEPCAGEVWVKNEARNSLLDKPSDHAPVVKAVERSQLRLSLGLFRLMAFVERPEAFIECADSRIQFGRGKRDTARRDGGAGCGPQAIDAQGELRVRGDERQDEECEADKRHYDEEDD